jgi:hypothetical protein
MSFIDAFADGLYLAAAGFIRVAPHQQVVRRILLLGELEIGSNSSE